ncbi:ethanolamine utilization protein EutJ [Pseudodesulfovibrio cashew]|uniref:Ethanolamine utilization protein EutJ n=1 Tax=Pseudodesulfovibrio cashew TaxID=2678688 RepID=A0A6I6JPC6_9BACT|nr:ethanolamine utilization protein EutJ [Pseudodesulfovibrio cashew]QGY41893.1 ethanolamine utilization protein EutJ [Pseudodesulfovibrio cashew]
MDFSVVDRKLSALERCLTETVPVSADERLRVGVDLGTAYIVVVVLNDAGDPVACAMEFARVVKDGLVVDYIGATRIVRRLVDDLGRRLGRTLTRAAIAVPPLTGGKDCKTHRYVVEGAGLEVTGTLDEPTAANAVLGLENGVVVDIGGGTTGLSVLEAGEVVYVADEATGGTHVSLVLAGNYDLTLNEAEEFKMDRSRQAEVLSVVRPVIQKMASIVARHIDGRNVSSICLVGGTCCLEGLEGVMEKELGLPVFKPANPFLVTPMGIALNCA